MPAIHYAVQYGNSEENAKHEAHIEFIRRVAEQLPSEPSSCPEFEIRIQKAVVA